MSDRDLSIASSDLNQNRVPFDLWAGDSNIVTTPLTIAQSATVYPQFSPLAMDAATGKLRLATVDGGVSDNIVAVTPYAYDATAGDIVKAVYTGGYFNLRALAWPAEFTTDVLKLSGFAGTNLTARNVPAPAI